MAKVLILLDKSPYTSFGRIAHSFVEALEDEHEVKTCYLTSPEYFHNDLELDGFQVSSPKFFLGLFFYPKGVRKVIAKFEADWVIAIRPELGFLIKDISKHYPHVKTTVMIHDMFAETLYPDSFKFKLINKYFIDPMLVADSFIYNSRYSLTETEKHYGENEVKPKGDTIVGCVVHSDQFYSLEESSTHLKAKWKIEISQKVYLTLCLDEPRKNIKTFFKIAQARPDALFIRVGELSPWMHDFLTEHQIKNVVHYHKIPLEQIRELYNLSDALVYTSYLEGFGYPPFEAMACGTQVISSNTSAMKENLQGVAHLVDDPEDVDGFLRAIQKSEKNPVDINQMGKRVNEFSLENFQQKILAHGINLGL